MAYKVIKKEGSNYKYYVLMNEFHTMVPNIGAKFVQYLFPLLMQVDKLDDDIRDAIKTMIATKKTLVTPDEIKRYLRIKDKPKR